MENLKKDTDEFMGRYSTLNRGNSLLNTLVESTTLKNLKNINSIEYANDEAVNSTKKRIAFIGNTSNGKSSLINAIIGTKIMPSGKGRTTPCFVSIHGHESDMKYLTYNHENNEPIELLETLAHFKSLNKATEDSLINVFLPISQCSLLNNPCELIDCPGIDCTGLTECNRTKYFQDGDVFVYVIDGEGNFGFTDRSVIISIKYKFPNTSILFVINKWDRCDDEDNIEDLRKQHLESIRTFLEEDLQYSNDPTGIIFFISATEAQSQCQGTLPASKVERQKEFQRLIDTIHSLSATRLPGNKHGEKMSRFENYLNTLHDKVNFEIKLPEKSPDEKLRTSIEELIKATFININKNVQEKVTERFSEFSFTKKDHSQTSQNSSIDDIIKDILETTAFVELDEISNKIRMMMMEICDEVIITDKSKTYDLVVPRDTPTIDTVPFCYEMDKYYHWRTLVTETSSKYKFRAGLISIGICLMVKLHNFLNPVKKEKEKFELQLRTMIDKSIQKTLKDCQVTVEKDATEKLELFKKNYEEYVEFVKFFNLFRSKLTTQLS